MNLYSLLPGFEPQPAAALVYEADGLPPCSVSSTTLGLVSAATKIFKSSVNLLKINFDKPLYNQLSPFFNMTNNVALFFTKIKSLLVDTHLGQK